MSGTATDDNDALPPMQERLIFHIPMRPVAWNRPGGVGRRYDTQLHEKGVFTELVIQAINKAYKCSILDDVTHPIMGDGPLMLNATFTFKEGATNNALFPIQDLDNLVKFAQDAIQSQGLKGVIWKDDRQIVAASTLKKWGPEDRMSFMIVKLDKRS